MDGPPQAASAASTIATDPFDLTRCTRDQIVEATAGQLAQRKDHAARMVEGESAFADRRWDDAGRAFLSALALLPYDGGAWLWFARVAAAQKQIVPAEIACRTACAYGASVEEAREVLDTALADLGGVGALPRLRQHRTGPTSGQVPGQPDILLLASLAWGGRPMADEEQLDYLRRCDTLDAAFAQMIADPRFSAVNREWLATKPQWVA